MSHAGASEGLAIGGGREASPWPPVALPCQAIKGQSEWAQALPLGPHPPGESTQGWVEPPPGPLPDLLSWQPLQSRPSFRHKWAQELRRAPLGLTHRCWGRVSGEARRGQAGAPNKPV